MGVTVRWIVLGGLALACCPIAAQDCPRLETSLPFGRPTRVAVLGEFAYFGIGWGVMAVDGSDPTSLRVVARLPLPGEVRDIAVEGSRAYVAMGETGVQVLDLTDPSQPAEIGSPGSPASWRTLDLATAGDPSRWSSTVP